MTEGLKFLLGFAIVAFIPVAWVIGDELLKEFRLGESNG